MDSRTKNSASPTKPALKGFTLVELLIAITILSLVLGGVFSTFFSFSKSTKFSLNHIDQSAELQYAFESILKTIRAASEVHRTDPTVFEFTTTHMDGSTERVRYSYNADTGEFMRTSITDKSSRVLISNVSGVEFTYYDRFGEETPTQIDINAAKLEITSEREAMKGAKSVSTETALITLRNRSL